MSACRICPVRGGLERAAPYRSGMSLKIARNFCYQAISLIEGVNVRSFQGGQERFSAFPRVFPEQAVCTSVQRSARWCL